MRGTADWLSAPLQKREEATVPVHIWTPGTLDVLLETGLGTAAPAAAAAQLPEDAESARLRQFGQRVRDYAAGGYLARFGSGVELSDPTVSAFLAADGEALVLIGATLI